jgi:hypothetical protein
MIPVVAHLFGVNATRFASDVRIANPHETPREVTLIFTRSGENGLTSFAAMNVSVAPGQTVAFDDVVDSVFHTVGSGSLEILGDVIAMSRTYAETAAGTLGQQVPPVTDATERGVASLGLAPLPQERTRYNIGITEISGSAGAVMVGARQIELQPFSHVQIVGDSSYASVSVISGQARVAAYVSQVNEIGDPMFIPAQRPPNDLALRFAPAISVDRWRTDVWFSSAEGVRVELDALWVKLRLRFGAFSVGINANELAGSRIHSSSGTDQFVPFAGFSFRNERQLVFIETTPPYRTNIGIFNSSSRSTAAEVVVYDAAGIEVQREILRTINGVAQMLVVPQITSGRAVVRFLDGPDFGPGRQAYASLIDDRTGDATYIEGQ